LKNSKIYGEIINKYVLHSLIRGLLYAGNLCQIKRESRVRGNAPARFADGGKDRDSNI
jgi:hypothetical protein